jgi:hypothetical protein
VREWDPDEQRSIDADLPIVARWIEQNSESGATVAVDTAAFDSNQGHVLLVVHVKDRADLQRIRHVLTASVNYPDRLRVMVRQRSLEEIEQVQAWLHATQPRAGGDRTGISFSYIDPGAGQLVVALDRSDPAYAAQLEASTHGIARVLREPLGVDPANKPT